MEKKNKTQQKDFLKKLTAFLVVVVFAWFNFSNADLGKYNIFQDKDGDGLSDKEEFSYGTDPEKSDTDGDGYSDKAEIESGYDPLKPAPGDKIIVEGVQNQEVEKEKTNLTKKFFDEIKNQNSGEAGLINKIINEGEVDDETKKELLSTNENTISDVLEKTLEGEMTGLEETVSEEDFNILDKPEGTEEEVKKTEKEQIEKYMSSLVYILAVNRPFELNNTSELSNKISEFIYQAFDDVQNGNLEEVRQYKELLKTIFEQIGKLDVPFVMKDVHISLWSVYKTLYNDLDEEKLLSDDDPVAILFYLGKIEAAFSELEVIESDIESILEKYEIDSFDPNSIFGLDID